MKCCYTFPIVSDVAFDTSVIFKHGGLQFTLVSDKGRLSALQVEAFGVTFTSLPRIIPPKDGGIPEVRIPADPALPIVQNEIRAVKAALSVWGVHDIRVENPGLDWTPETEEERKATDIFGLSRQKAARGQGHLLPAPQDLLIRSILSRAKFLPLQIPLEFYRRGREDLYEDRYIEAIYDFYFVFEYLFGDGKYDNKGVKRAFLASNLARRAFASAQSFPVVQQGSDLETFNAKYKSQPIEKVIETVIKVRGFLHHQSLKRKNNWNPALQSDFKIDALFLQAAAQHAAAELATEVLFSTDEVATFKGTPVRTPDGATINWVPLPESGLSRKNAAPKGSQ